MNIETILTPAELSALTRRDLRESGCVVFDVLRATSTFVTALNNGASAIIPVAEIAEALAVRKRQADVLLGGERNGLKIGAALAGGTDFDLGNSPREYTPATVAGRTVVSTTTNGTRALRACARAQSVLAGSFLNLGATAAFIKKLQPADVVLVCAGTRENCALEDVLAAGALCALLPGRLSDSAALAQRAWEQARPDLAAAVHSSENAQRLGGIPELRDDVAFCLQRDVFPLVARMGADGVIRRHTGIDTFSRG